MGHDPVPLGTKGCVPRLPDRLVSRPRLERLLVDGVRHPVTLVSGPPGAGKTTLLGSGLASAPPDRAAWLSLDQRDNEPGRLTALVAAALHTAGCADRPATVDPSTSDRQLDGAFEQLTRRGRCVLVLDDVQELRSASALGTLTRLVTEAPDMLDVVLSSRADPPIRLERLRLDGRLAEIRYADLCFDRHEAAAFFAAHDVALTETESRALWERVEGWAAGLRLAACALRTEPDPRGFVADATATQTAVADYLFNEVLVREDDATQELLLRTSVAERLTPELAVALTGDARAGERLADLERRGLFLIGLGDHRCYRYHALFRALLQAHLRQREPDLIDGLHRRAAACYLAEHLPLEAEAHARAGRDWPLLGRLLLRRWLAGTTEETDPFAGDTLGGVSPADVLATPELALIAAAEACRWANREDADLYRGAANQAEAQEGDEEDRRRWTTACRLLDVTYGWTFGVDERSHAAVTELRRSDVPEAWTPRLRQLAVLASVEMDIGAGYLDRARHTLDELANHGEPQWHRVLAAAVLSLLDAAAGDVRAAEEQLEAVQGRLGTGADHPTTAHFVQVATALCAAQRGEQRRVAEALSAAGSSVEWSSRSLRCVDRALHAATRSRAPFFVSLDGPTARHPLAERTLVALGVLEVIDAAGRPIAIGGDGERAVGHARRLLGTQEGDRSPSTTVPADAWLHITGRRHPRTLVEGGVLAAIAADRRGDHSTADRVLCETLEISATTGIRAPLLDHGAHIRPVLERTSGDLGPSAVTALDLLDRLHHHGPVTLVEPLTKREIDVLQHLPTLMTNAEIARGLRMSINTVKTHLKAVYRKLGVEGRRAAVLRGRDLELI
jgi:LuxR family transcriptional regulator, maltose regulon positive regulatory protein